MRAIARSDDSTLAKAPQCCEERQAINRRASSDAAIGRPSQ